MKPILFLQTGGTIGSVSDHGIIRTGSASCHALDLYRRICKTDISFEIVPLMDILSENLQKQHWVRIIRYLLQKDLSPYSGIIITHGSDTLSYSSAMLGLCLHHLPIPVILTAADRIPDDPQSNALVNLHTSVRLIQHISNGVFTVYKNPASSVCQIYLATQIQEADRFVGAFSSPFGKCFGIMENDELIFLQNDLIPKLSQKSFSPLDTTDLTLDQDILLLHPYPGLDYRSITLSDKCKGVMHITYHSSSACADGGNSALSLLSRCQQRHIPFYLASFPKNADSRYESADILLKNGALPIPHCTNESAYAKLLLCMNLFPERYDQLMQENWYWEYLP